MLPINEKVLDGLIDAVRKNQDWAKLENYCLFWEEEGAKISSKIVFGWQGSGMIEVLSKIDLENETLSFSNLVEKISSLISEGILAQQNLSKEIKRYKLPLKKVKTKRLRRKM